MSGISLVEGISVKTCPTWVFSRHFSCSLLSLHEYFTNINDFSLQKPFWNIKTQFPITVRKQRELQVKEHRVILSYQEWHGWSLFFQSLCLSPCLSLSSNSSHWHKTCSVFSVKLQLIQLSLLKHCLGKIPLPMPLSRDGGQIQLAGAVSSFLTTLPSSTNLKLVLPIRPSTKGGDADNKSLLSVGSGSCREVIPALNPIQCMGQQGDLQSDLQPWRAAFPLFYPRLSHISFINVLFVHEWVRERPGTAEQMVLLTLVRQGPSLLQESQASLLAQET